MHISCSSSLGKTDDFSILSEALPAQKQVILADETNLASASSAFTTVLSEFTRMGSPEKVGHLW